MAKQKDYLGFDEPKWRNQRREMNQVCKRSCIKQYKFIIRDRAQNLIKYCGNIRSN